MKTLEEIESEFRKQGLAFYIDEYSEFDSDKLFISINDLIFHFNKIIEILKEPHESNNQH